MAKWIWDSIVLLAKMMYLLPLSIIAVLLTVLIGIGKLLRLGKVRTFFTSIFGEEEFTHD